jgi:Uma2 family endonuclease
MGIYTFNLWKCPMTVLTHSTTAEELLRIPDDGFRYELVREKLRKRTLAENTHGRIAALLTGSLVQHVIAHQLGKIYAAETGFKISSDPDTVRAPDVAFIQQQRLQKIGPVEGYWPGAPDLVAEVVSPNDRYTDVEEKVSDWLDAGTRKYHVNVACKAPGKSDFSLNKENQTDVVAASADHQSRYRP